MRAARIALVLAAMVLVPATTAHAAERIGSTLAAAPDTAPPCTASCTVTQTEATAASAGVITRWQVRSGAATQMRLQILDGDQVAAESADVTAAASGVSTFPARIAIGAGDAIALRCCETNTPLIRAGGPGDGRIFEPALPSTATAAPYPGELQLGADVEPDGDGDGFGDETQDNCVGVANGPQADRDHDGRGDPCDVCPDVFGAQANGCPVAASPPPPPPNRPPVVRFREPLSGTVVGPSVRIVLDAVDDRGAPTVSLFDDDGTICVLRAAPYACTWTATGADVGRATLLASAVDAGGLSTLGIVRVRVNRFEATLTKPKTKRLKRGRLRVTGRLALPRVVTRAQGCSGEVRVRVRKVAKTVSLTRRCRYAAVLKVRAAKPRVRFGGNSVLRPT